MALEDLFEWFPWDFAPEEGLDFGFLPGDVSGEPLFDFSAVPDTDFPEMVRRGGGLSLFGADTGFPTSEAVAAALDTRRQAVPLSLGVEGTRPALVDFADGPKVIGRLGEEPGLDSPPRGGFPGFDPRLGSGAPPRLERFLDALARGLDLPRPTAGGTGGLSIPIISFGNAPSGPTIPALKSAMEAPARFSPAPDVLPFHPAPAATVPTAPQEAVSGFDRLIPADPFTETRATLERDRRLAALRGVF